MTPRVSNGIPLHSHSKRGCGGFLAVVVALLTCLGFVGVRADAQATGLATLTGTVTDQTGAVVVKAHVTATNSATGVPYSSVTNSTGYFELDSLTTGVYDILVTAPNFENLLRKGITLDASAVVSVPLELHVGRASETMTVAADATLLNTEGESSGQVLTTRQIENLPVEGVNPIVMVLVAPGVQTWLAQTSSTGGTLGWNGLANFGTTGIIHANEFSMDGAPNMAGRGNANNPTAEELGEMKIDATGFDASVGHTMGVAVVQTTKSGSNELHGSLRWTYQAKNWSALNHFQGLNYKYHRSLDNCSANPDSAACKLDVTNFGYPASHDNNGALAIGGPVYIPKVYDGRNKLFWFVSILDQVYGGPGLYNLTIPTLRQRKGDFSDLPQQTSNIPASFVNACGTGTPYYGQYQIYDPFNIQLDSNGVPRRAPICGNVLPADRLADNGMVKLYNSLLPDPTENSPTGGNFSYGNYSAQTYRDFTGRGDWAISQKDHFFIRFTRSAYTNNATGFTVGDVDLQSGPRWVYLGSVGYNHIFSDKMNLDITVGGSNYNTKCCFYPNYDKYKPSDIGLPSYTDSYAGAGAELPVLSVNSYQQIGNVDNTNNIVSNYAVRADLTRVQGRHTIRAGGEYRTQNAQQGIQGNLSGTYNFDNSYTQENNGSDPNFSQSNIGLSYAAFLMGVQSSASVSQSAAYNLSSPYFAFFAGDTWRVTPKLTIVPGLRFEYEYGVQEKHNQMIVGWDFNADLSSISGPANTAYQGILAGLTPAQQQVLPPTLAIAGGPVYAGVNGASTRQWNNNYRFLPRLAIAYQVRPDTVIRAGFGLFFDTLNAGNPSIDQDGYSTSTGYSISTEYGPYGINLKPGDTPLADPFPANSSGVRFNTPIGNAAGSLYYVGGGPGIYDHNLVPARTYRSQIGIQHQFGASTMVELNWTGALTTDITMGKGYTFTPAQFYAGGIQPYTVPNNLLSTQIPNPFALANFSGVATTNPAAYGLMSHSGFFTNSTTSIGSLLHAYPQMGGLSINRAIGESKFQEIQLNVNRRASKGLTLMGEIQFNRGDDRDYFANGFDPQPSWEPSNNSVPVRFTTEGIYDIPVGRGHAWANSGWKNAVFGGYQLSGIYEAQMGQLIGWGNNFYVGEIRASAIKIKHPIYQNDESANGGAYVKWLDAGNVTAIPNTITAPDGTQTTTCVYQGTGFVTNPQCQASGYNLRVFPTRLKGVRQMGFNNVSANVQKFFPLRENIGLETRLEVYNLFNHQGLGGPNTNPTDPHFGWITGDGWPNSMGRWFAVQARLRF